MNTYHWTSHELRLLEEWDWLTRYIGAHKNQQLSDNLVQRQLLLEAKLVVCNKLIIAYNFISSEPVAILSFKEYLAEREKSIDRLALPTQYHPINFNSLWDYRSFLSSTREKMMQL